MVHLHHNKNLVMPLAIVLGAIFYKWMGYLEFLSPWLIFAMLFITYCKLTPRDIRLGKFEWGLLIVQWVMSALCFVALLPLGHLVAEGVFICVFVPTATAAPVITSMLGGKLSKVASYSLLCNLVMAATAPLVLAYVGDNATLTFHQSFLLILRRVTPLLLGPIAAAFAMRYLSPRLHKTVVGHQQLSFYLWSVSLIIIVGCCVSFAIKTWDIKNVVPMVYMIVGALVVCLIQFVVGRRVGVRLGADAVSGAQSLMQKNTVLAVWLALTYMNPIASIAPAAYIIWQNMLNSAQLMLHDRKLKQMQDMKQ